MRQGALRVLGVGVVLTCARVCTEFTISDLVLPSCCKASGCYACAAVLFVVFALLVVLYKVVHTFI